MNDSKLRASTAKVVLRPIESSRPTRKRLKPATTKGKYRHTHTIKRDKINQLSTPTTVNLQKQAELTRAKSTVPVGNVNACFNKLIHSSKKEKKKVKKHQGSLKRISAPQHLFPSPQASSVGFAQHDHMINFAEKAKDSPLVSKAKKDDDVESLNEKYANYTQEEFTREIYNEVKKTKGGKPPLLVQMEQFVKRELKQLKEDTFSLEEKANYQHLFDGLNTPGTMSGLDLPMRDDMGHRLSTDPTSHIEAVRTNTPISQYDIQRLQIFREVFHALRADFKKFGPLFHSIQSTYEKTCKILSDQIVKVKNDVPLKNQQHREVAVAGHHLKTYQQTRTEQEVTMHNNLKKSYQAYDHKLFTYRKTIQDLEERRENLVETLSKKRENGNHYMFELHDQVEGTNLKLKDEVRDHNALLATTESFKNKIERIQTDIDASKENIIDPELISRQQLLKEQYMKRVKQYNEQLDHYKIANRLLHRTIKRLTSVTISSENVNEKLTIFERSLSPRPQWETLKSTYEDSFDFLPDDRIRAKEEQLAIKQGLSILDISDYTKNTARSNLNSANSEMSYEHQQEEIEEDKNSSEAIVQDSDEDDDVVETAKNPLIQIKNPSSKPILNIEVNTPVSEPDHDFDKVVSLVEADVPQLNLSSLVVPQADDRLSTQNSVDALLKYIVMASDRIKKNNKEIEINAGKLSFLNSEEFEAERNERKYFYGLGMSENIPKYMRFTGRLRRKNIGKRECELILEDFWEKRRQERSACTTVQEVSDFEDFLIEYFKKTKSVIRSVYMEWIYNVLDACERFIDDADCELFLRILRGEICELTYYDQFSMLERLQHYLSHGGHLSKSHKKEKNTITRKKLIKLCKAFFKAKSVDRMREIEREIKHSVKTKRVKVSILFEETRDKNQSPFVECIRDQYCQEIIEFGDDISDSLQMHTEDGNLSVLNIRKAFYHVDPSCKVKDVDKMIVTTFEALGKYDIEPLDPEMSVKSDIFSNQLKKSCLLKRHTKISEVAKVKKKHKNKLSRSKSKKHITSPSPMDDEPAAPEYSLDDFANTPSTLDNTPPSFISIDTNTNPSSSLTLKSGSTPFDMLENNSVLSNQGLVTPIQFNQKTEFFSSSSINSNSVTTTNSTTSSSLRRSILKKQFNSSTTTKTSSMVMKESAHSYESFPPLRVPISENDDDFVEETPLPVPKTSVMF